MRIQNCDPARAIRPAEEAMKDINMLESMVPEREVPSVLVKEDGSVVKNAWEWMNLRRPEVLDFYRREVFGSLPPRADNMSIEVLSEKRDALDNTAIRKEIKITFSMNNGESRSMVMLLYKPQNIQKPVPAFVELNFKGNHAASPEDDCIITGFDVNGDVFCQDRSALQMRFPAKTIVSKGYALATVCYYDIFPDISVDWAVDDDELEKKAWQRSIYGMFFPGADLSELKAKYSAIGAWAWGLCRMLDVLECDPDIDRSKVGCCGHSRLGKTSLWAGANDERFKVVVTNDSGHGGSALFRRCLGESIEILIARFPHWFVSGFTKFARQDADLSWDQNFLLSLIAPRALCIGSATEDLWADPKGEFLSGVYASEVWRLFGGQGMPVTEHPAPEVNVTGEISYHLRTGQHNILEQDWEHYLEAADNFFCRK